MTFPLTRSYMQNPGKYARPHMTRNEPLIFERSSIGKTGIDLPSLKVPEVSAAELARCLGEITGMHAVSLQPAAGAQGELAGLLMIRAFLEDRGSHRKYVLVPDSAHGTNPASATMARYESRTVKSSPSGCIDI